MNQVRFGIVGIGNMGGHHAKGFFRKEIEGATLGALCDSDPAKLESLKGQFPGVPVFNNHKEMMKSGLVDAVLVATPHYDHPPIAIDGFAHNLHVLVEKPAAVSVKAAKQMNDAAAKNPNVKFGIMFNQRSSRMYQKLREVLADGELGQITRVTWIITDWFRTWSYYASGGWRATWEGEGGGVLINQCPHNLDLIQWITGMRPNRVTAVGFVGKTHPIEVEDEISAIMEYPNGAVGHFITTTGEAPGTNRLEICGDRGKIVAEHGKLKFTRTRKNVRDILEKSTKSFEHVECWDLDIPFASGPAEQHKTITQNFVNAILNGEKLIAPGEEGIHGLDLGNAIMMSGLTRKSVEMPVNGDEYDAFIEDMKKKYGGKKSLATNKSAGVDMAASFR